MKVAALDLGSNTFLCLIAEVESLADAKGGEDSFRITKVYDDQVRMVRLGQDVAKTGRFHVDALKRADTALSSFAEIIEREKPERILAMATSAARDATNKAELFALGDKYKIPIEVIPGGREAEITFAGAVSGLERPANTEFLVIDVGGGSTEFILGRKDTSSPKGQSLNLGCVRMKEAAARNSLQELRQKVRKELAALKISTDTGTRSPEVLAVAGTPTELARMEVGVFDPARIEGYTFTIEQLETWVEKLFLLTPTQITEKYQTDPGRADVMIYGALILAESLRHFSATSLTVSIRGVRYGVALDIAKGLQR